MANKDYHISGTNGNGQRVGITVSASDKFAAEAAARQILESKTQNGNRQFSQWDRKESGQKK